ncbi:MAG: ABC transporter substrate-binding protein [Gammaproteobacteria bacterium]|nr:ABC transporter substrate-binding protein [Gammaproteobacteria bacterium]
MMRHLFRFLLLAGVLAGAAAPGSETPKIDTSGPSQLIGSVAEAMLASLDAHRAEYRHDPKRIDALVDELMLPHFDTQYAARLVLGRYWTTASAEQRARFVDAFYHSMLRNYGRALVEFTADRLKVLPYQGGADATTATVRTQVRKNDGTQVAVNYTLRRTPQGWKAWDVVIEGVSYVKSFRDDFGSEIEQHGLNALIDRLEKQQGAPSDAQS